MGSFHGPRGRFADGILALDFFPSMNAMNMETIKEGMQRRLREREDGFPFWIMGCSYLDIWYDWFDSIIAFCRSFELIQLVIHAKFSSTIACSVRLFYQMVEREKKQM